MQGKPIEAIERGQHRAPTHRNIFVGTYCCHVRIACNKNWHFKILRKRKTVTFDHPLIRNIRLVPDSGPSK